MLNRMMFTFPTSNFNQVDKKLESVDSNSFMPVSKVWFSLHTFSQKSPSHNKFLWRSRVLNIKKSDEKCRKWANINLHH